MLTGGVVSTHVGFNSIRRRRQWAMTLYFAIYLGVWVAFGVLALAAERLARQALGLEARLLHRVSDRARFSRSGSGWAANGLRV